MASIVMVAYQREQQLNRTLQSIQGKHELVIIPDLRPHAEGQFLNPAPLWNQGVREATQDVLILQNPECEHHGNVAEVLSQIPRGEAWFASCQALNEDGSPDRWYCHPVYRKEPFFFCGAIHKADMVPYNEAYTEYGYEDNQLADDLKANGIKFRWLYPEEALVFHQWHPPYTGNSSSRSVYESLNLHPVKG